MSIPEYDLLVCGATLSGLGAAAAAREAGRKVIVVERMALTGNEFIEAFNPGSERTEPKTEFGIRFRDELAKRGLIGDNGLIHLPALHPVLCLLIDSQSLKVRFLTEIVDVAKQGDTHEVLLHDSSGFQRINAKEILDTTSLRLSTPGRLFQPKRKWINSYLHSPSVGVEPAPAPFDESISVCGGRFPSEVILKLEIPPGGSWQEARRRLYQLWKNRPEEWKSWTIAATASAFENEIPFASEAISDTWFWLPSESYPNPLAAIDEGYAFAQNMGGAERAASASH